MVGADKSTELWRHPIASDYLDSLVNGWPWVRIPVTDLEKIFDTFQIHAKLLYGRMTTRKMFVAFNNYCLGMK